MNADWIFGKSLQYKQFMVCVVEMAKRWLCWISNIKALETNISMQKNVKVANYTSETIQIAKYRSVWSELRRQPTQLEYACCFNTSKSDAENTKKTTWPPFGTEENANWNSNVSNESITITQQIKSERRQNIAGESINYACMFSTANWMRNKLYGNFVCYLPNRIASALFLRPFSLRFIRTSHSSNIDEHFNSGKRIAIDETHPNLNIRI